MNSNIEYWRFEALYNFGTTTSSSALNFKINQPPTNGNCTIDPLSGTTDTEFTVECSNWFDEQDILDYSLYGKYFYSYMKVLEVF